MMNLDVLNNFLEETPLLNIHNASIFILNETHGWKKHPPKKRTEEIYYFVQNSIAYAFPNAPFLPASEILSLGYGMSVSKAILLMALLRSVHIPCRFHGFLIKKDVLRDIPDSATYKKIPPLIVHGWTEVFLNDQWIILEGVTLPITLVEMQRKKIHQETGEFNGLGLGVHELNHLTYRWNGHHTFIQRNAILRDYSVFDSPDHFSIAFGNELKDIRTYYPPKKILKKLNKYLFSLQEMLPST